MRNISLDQLTRLEPREVWANEATDFTPWLAQDENFAILAEALHFFEAEVEGTEQAVGDFSADIIARDRDGYILVENQLAQTDHTHLGQILTYLAGLEGSVKVVWVSTKVREEHRAAIDWLNSHTPSEFAFFAVELELFRIGSSPAAPHFHVVAKPNEWSRHVSSRSRSVASNTVDDRQRRYREHWSAFAEFMKESDNSFSSLTPSKAHWWGLSLGRAGFQISLIATTRDRWAGVEVYVQDDPDKLVFDHFLEDKHNIEEDFGAELEWERLDGKKASRIAIRLRDVDPLEAEARDRVFPWYKEQLERMRRTFSWRIRELDIEAL